MNITPEREKDYIFGHDESGAEFVVSEDARRAHMHVVGASGKGKSKFLEMMIRQDLLNRNVGGCVIDPHGLLVDDIMNYVSHHRPHLADKIVLFEPDSQTDNITGFNPIPQDYDNIPQAVGEIIETILFAWGEHGERLPRIRAQMFNILYPILANNLTLVEALPMISIHAKEERAEITKGVKFAPVLAAWNTFENASNLTKLNLLEGPSNRFMRILSNEHMRLILSQKKNALDLAEIMAGRKMLLVSLRNYNRIGSDNLRMLGVMILSELFRVGMKRNERLRPPPFHVYIDEFGEYVTPAVAKALDQIRKKNVFFTVAHQHLAQLEEQGRDQQLVKSVLTNCRLKVAFGGMEPEDADRISKLLWTGHLDLKEIKHEQPVTKERTVEELRTSRSRGRTVSDGTSQSESEGVNWTDGHSDGYSDTSGWGVTEAQMNGWSKADSASQTRQRGWSRAQANQSNWSQGTNQIHSSGASLTKGSARSYGTNQGSSTTRSTSETEGTANTLGTSRSHSATSNQSIGSGGSESRHSAHDDVGTVLSNNESYGSGTSDSEGASESRTASKSKTKSESTSNSSGTSTNDTKSMNHGTNYSDSHGSSAQRGGGRSFTAARSGGDGSSRGHTDTKSGSASYSEARSGAHSETHADSHSEGGNRSQSRGTSHNEGWTETETTGPYAAKYEYEEVVSTSFYSVADQQHKKLGDLMNLPTGFALAKNDIAKPVKIRIPYIPDVRWRGESSLERLEETEVRIRESNATYYAPRSAVLAEAEARQMKFFKKPLLLDEVGLDDMPIDESEGEELDDGWNIE